jgi:hypothetical protein
VETGDKRENIKEKPENTNMKGKGKLERKYMAPGGRNIVIGRLIDLFEGWNNLSSTKTIICKVLVGKYDFQTFNNHKTTINC